jgi:hypothetical protein
MRDTVSVLGRRDDGRDALMHAALDRGPAARAAWTTWRAAGGTDDDPVALRWLPLIAANLATEDLDASSRELLARVRHGIWAANLRLCTSTLPAIEALIASGVDVVVLKGAALAYTAYDTPALRAIGDIDVLVRPGELMCVHAQLTRANWRTLRRINLHDCLLAHGVDYRRPPNGALDVHAYLLHECCWPGADTRLWERTRPAVVAGIRVLVPGAADQLLHTCVHGLRWSPVHSGHWVADAVHVIANAGTDLDWDVLIAEASARDLSLQVASALAFVASNGWARIPAPVLRELRAHRPSWRMRLECRNKTQPVVSAGGLFVIWCGWRRAVRGARRAGGPRPPWLRYLAAAVGVESRSALPAWAGRHLRAKALALVGQSTRRGTSAHDRFPARDAAC